MNDSLDIVDDDEKGIELYHQRSALWAKAGMHARKWVSNSDKVMATIPEQDQTVEVHIGDNKGAVRKMLGLPASGTAPKMYWWCLQHQNRLTILLLSGML